jgi:hypothetical protein
MQTPDDTAEMVVTERAGLVAWKLARGARLTNREIQRMTGLGQPGAWLLMGRLSRCLPIWFGDGVWRHVQDVDSVPVADGFEGRPPMK